MVVELRRFSGVDELVKRLDTVLERYNKVLSVLLRVLEEYRVVAEGEKRIRQLIERLGGRGGGGGGGGLVFDVDGCVVMVNPSAGDVVRFLEERIEEINNRVARIQQVRRRLSQLADALQGFPVVALIVDDVPVLVLVAASPVSPLLEAASGGGGG